MQDDRHRIPCSMTDMECERSDLCGKLIDVSIKLMTADRLLVIGKEIWHGRLTTQGRRSNGTALDLDIVSKLYLQHTRDSRMCSVCIPWRHLTRAYLQVLLWCSILTINWHIIQVTSGNTQYDAFGLCNRRFLFLSSISIHNVIQYRKHVFYRIHHNTNVYGYTSYGILNNKHDTFM